jgi:predicted small secreted protein
MLPARNQSPGQPFEGASYNQSAVETKMRKNLATACLTLFLLSGTAVLLSACNTTEGMGRDVSAAGHAVSNTAADVKQRM